MGLFSKSKPQPAALPKPDFNSAAQTESKANPLRAKFSKARFGHTCRTLTLCNPEGDNLNVYRQMICLSPGDKGWRIIEISDYPTETDEIALKNKTVEDQLGFLDAIENIAMWQAGQIKLGYTAAADEAGKLGIQYFIPFGERENLAFDIHGQPHTTFEGEVVTDGYFTPTARENAKASIVEPPPPPPPAPPLPGFDPFAQMKFAEPSSDGDLKEIMKKMENHAAARDLLQHLREMTTVLKTLFESELADGSIPDLMNKASYSFHHMLDWTEITKDPNKLKAVRFFARTLNQSQTVDKYIEQRSEKCLQIISSLKLEKEERYGLSQMVSAYKVLYYALASKFTIGIADKAETERARLMQDANRLAQQANSAYYQLSNNNHDLWKIRVLILQDEEPLKVPDIFDEFNDRLEKALDEAKLRLTQERKQALSPLVAPDAKLALPKPQNP